MSKKMKFTLLVILLSLLARDVQGRLVQSKKLTPEINYP
jgi:hypothetical protein